MKRHPILILSLLAVSVVGSFVRAQAAPDVSLTISAVSQGPGQAVSTLTWLATPTPSSCTASGDWTGTKAASGTAAQPLATANKNYVLACTFAADSTALVSWTAPTTNTDGSALTDLAGFNVYWNVGDPSLVTAPSGKVRAITSPATLSTLISGLMPGNWYFAVTTVNSKGVESAISNIVTKTIGASTVVTKNASLVFPGTTVVTVK